MPNPGNASGDLLDRIQTRSHLEEVNHFLLHDEGEIIEAPGKLSLVWVDPIRDTRRFLAVKAAGDDQILVNGRRFPASAEGLRRGLRACLSGQG